MKTAEELQREKEEILRSTPDNAYQGGGDERIRIDAGMEEDVDLTTYQKSIDYYKNKYGSSGHTAEAIDIPDHSTAEGQIQSGLKSLAITLMTQAAFKMTGLDANPEDAAAAKAAALGAGLQSYGVDADRHFRKQQFVDLVAEDHSPAAINQYILDGSYDHLIKDKANRGKITDGREYANRWQEVGATGKVERFLLENGIATQKQINANPVAKVLFDNEGKILQASLSKTPEKTAVKAPDTGKLKTIVIDELGSQKGQLSDKVYENTYSFNDKTGAKTFLGGALKSASGSGNTPANKWKKVAMGPNVRDWFLTSGNYTEEQISGFDNAEVLFNNSGDIISARLSSKLKESVAPINKWQEVAMTEEIRSKLKEQGLLTKNINQYKNARVLYDNNGNIVKATPINKKGDTGVDGAKNYATAKENFDALSEISLQDVENVDGYTSKLQTNPLLRSSAMDGSIGKFERVLSQGFLANVDKLRGLGQLTEQEGRKLVNAYTSLVDRETGQFKVGLRKEDIMYELARLKRYSNRAMERGKFQEATNRNPRIEEDNLIRKGAEVTTNKQGEPVLVLYDGNGKATQVLEIN